MFDQIKPPPQRSERPQSSHQLHLSRRLGGRRQPGESTNDLEVDCTLCAEVVVQVGACGSCCAGELGSRYVLVSAFGEQTLGDLEDLLTSIARCEPRATCRAGGGHVATVGRLPAARVLPMAGGAAGICYRPRCPFIEMVRPPPNDRGRTITMRPRRLCHVRTLLCRCECVSARARRCSTTWTRTRWPRCSTLRPR